MCKSSDTPVGGIGVSSLLHLEHCQRELPPPWDSQRPSASPNAMNLGIKNFCRGLPHNNTSLIIDLQLSETMKMQQHRPDSTLYKSEYNPCKNLAKIVYIFFNFQQRLMSRFAPGHLSLKTTNRQLALPCLLLLLYYRLLSSQEHPLHSFCPTTSTSFWLFSICHTIHGIPLILVLWEYVNTCFLLPSITLRISFMLLSTVTLTGQEF